ncbi:MAG: DUF2267 domain-containing protein [Candidatus Binataceae bacterium]
MDEKTFFKSIAERLRCDEQRAEAITFAVFQELRDRLTPAEVSHVAAQLSKPLKDLWLSLDKPDRAVRKIHESQFIAEVRRIGALPDDAEAERGVLAVFATLQSALGSPTGREGEARDVFSQLPKDLKRLWLAAAQSGAA